MMVKRVYKRYSEAFKIQVVREYEEAQVSLHALQLKYGIKGSHTIEKWVKKYGKEGLRHKTVVIQKPEERDQVKELKERNRRLEELVAQLSLDKLLLESTLAVIEREHGIEVKKNGPTLLKKPLGGGRPTR